MRLLIQLQEDLGLTYLFISHDLGIVRFVSSQTAVMYLGKIVEQGPTEGLFQNPRHPYPEPCCLPTSHLIQMFEEARWF